MIRNIFVISGLIAFSALNAQKIHTVVKGDNPYNISKKYGLSIDDLYRLNPKVQDGKIAIGEVLVVNKSTVSVQTGASKTSASASKTQAEIGKIVLQPKQTVYGITKQYRISETDLRALNPNLDSHMKIGDEVWLPAESIAKYGAGQVNVAENNPAPTAVVSAVEVNGTSERYQIQEKDNYYKLTRKFNVTQKELFALNPGLEDKGLQPGETILIKGAANGTGGTKAGSTATQVVDTMPPNTYSTTSVSDDYVTYTVQSGDTVFGILNKFGI